MSTSTMIHGCRSIETNTVSRTNANAVTMCIKTSSGDFDITLFDLPTSFADALSEVFLYGAVNAKKEEDIRKDERRRIAAKIGVDG